MRNNSIHTLLHIRSLPYFVCYRKADFMVSARNSMLQPCTRTADHISLQAVVPVVQCFILLLLHLCMSASSVENNWHTRLQVCCVSIRLNLYGFKFSQRFCTRYKFYRMWCHEDGWTYKRLEGSQCLHLQRKKCKEEWYKLFHCTDSSWKKIEVDYSAKLLSTFKLDVVYMPTQFCARICPFMSSRSKGSVSEKCNTNYDICFKL
jgi:hypothetical protein